MYPQGSAIADSASNRVNDFALGIDRDFFRSLVTHGGSERSRDGY